MCRISRAGFRLTMLFGSALMLTSCARSPGKLSADLPKACLDLPGKVKMPHIVWESDYRNLAAEALAALRIANRRIDAKEKCERYVIDEYAKADTQPQFRLPGFSR